MRELGKTARSLVLASAAVVVSLSSIVACGSPPPPKPVEMVPADTWTPPPSSDDSTTTSGASTDGDAGPTGGMTGTTSSNGSGTGSGAGNGKPAGSGNNAQANVPEKIGGDTSSGSTTPAAPAPPTIAKASGPKVTKAECKKVLDKYIDLAIAADPNLQGLPPDVIKQAFAQAAQQSANPCDGDGVSRNQYKCAMKATSTDKWQACMK